MSSPLARLRTLFASGSDCPTDCTCPSCDLRKIEGALRWYGEEASALAVNMMEKRDMAVLASVQVLSLDAGSRARAILGDT